MKKLLLIAALIFSGVSVAGAQSITGDWTGALDTGSGDLHLALHITQAKDGGYQGTLDSLDQNANGIPLSNIVLKDSNLTFEVPTVHGSYTGKVKPDSSEIDGTWTQGAPLSLNFTRAKPAAPAKPSSESAAVKSSDVDGDWSGTLDAGTAQFRLVFHIVNASAGLTATLDSLDQHAMGMQVTTVTRNESDLKMELTQIEATYTGKLNADRTMIKGTWTQGPNALPLDVSRSKQ